MSRRTIGLFLILCLCTLHAHAQSGITVAGSDPNAKIKHVINEETSTSTQNSGSQSNGTQNEGDGKTWAGRAIENTGNALGTAAEKIGGFFNGEAKFSDVHQISELSCSGIQNYLNQPKLQGCRASLSSYISSLGTDCNQMATNYIQENHIENLKKFRCAVKDESFVGSTDSMIQLSNGVAAQTATIYQSKANANVASTAEGGGDVMVSGFNEQGKAAVKAGATQSTIGVAQLALTYKLAKIASKNSQAAKALAYNENSNTSEEDLSACEAPSNYSENGPNLPKKCKLISRNKLAANNSGVIDEEGEKGFVKSQRDRHQKISEEASAAALKMGMSGVTNTAGGVQMIQYGKSLKDQAKNLQSEVQAYNTGLMPSDGNYVDIQGGPMPSYNPTTGNYSEATAANDSTKDDAPDVSMPASLGGGGADSGGLKDQAPFGDPMYNASNGGANNGGGGGSAGGLSGGSGDSGSPSDEEDKNQTGGITGYSSAEKGTAAGGFASTSGGGNRNGGSETDMNFNKLLEKFLPGQEEGAAKDSATLAQMQGHRGPASIEDDGSILGPNANLFTRVSNMMMAKFKKGSLK